MSREWFPQPGDVALIRVRNAADWEYGIKREGDTWLCRHGGTGTDVVAARALVVIDPEDHEAVERLAKVTWAQGGNDLDREPPGSRCRIIDTWQAALREYANPTPPKPDEPLGLGAVVEDAEGARWTRVGGTKNSWYRAHGHWSAYDDITATRVLSEGVTEDGAR